MFYTSVKNVLYYGTAGVDSLGKIVVHLLKHIVYILDYGRLWLVVVPYIIVARVL